MKQVIFFFFLFISTFDICAQRSFIDFKVGKTADATIRLIDNELIVNADWTNEVFQFEVVNNSPYPIYIPSPNLKRGFIQHFNLIDETVECILEDSEMAVGNSSDFIFVKAKSSKLFELDSDFYIKSCIGFKKPKNAYLVYREFHSKFKDTFLKEKLIKKDRGSRDIVEYLLTSKMKSMSIKIRYAED